MMLEMGIDFAINENYFRMLLIEYPGPHQQGSQRELDSNLLIHVLLQDFFQYPVNSLE